MSVACASRRLRYALAQLSRKKEVEVVSFGVATRSCRQCHFRTSTKGSLTDSPLGLVPTDDRQAIWGVPSCPRPNSNRNLETAISCVCVYPAGKAHSNIPRMRLAIGVAREPACSAPELGTAASHQVTEGRRKEDDCSGACIPEAGGKCKELCDDRIDSSFGSQSY